MMIVTNSSSVADIVSANPHHDVFLLGGSYKRERNQNIGLLTLEQKKIPCPLCFLGSQCCL